MINFKPILFIVSVKRLFSIISFGIVNIFFFYNLIPTTSFAQQIPIKFSYLTVENGLSHTDTKDIKQDKTGFIWIATLFGLDRYDGTTIKQFYNVLDPKNNAFRNRVRNIYPADDGKIWLATDAGIQCFDSHQGSYLLLKQTAKPNGLQNLTNIVKLKKNCLLTLSERKPFLHKIKGDSLIRVPLKVDPNLFFSDAVLDKYGNLWMTSIDGVYLLNSKNEFVKKIAFDNYTQGNLLKLYFNKNNQMVLLSAKTVLVLSYRIQKEEVLNNNIATATIASKIEASQQLTLIDIIQDKKENYWVSTNKGLLLYDSNFKLIQKIKSVDATNSLNTNHIEKLFIDKSECLWVCSFGGGVNYADLNAKRFYTFQHKPDVKNTLSGDHIRTVLEENKNQLWIGTNENGLNNYNYQTKKFTFYNTSSQPTALKSDVINSVVIDRSGNLWIGTDKGIEVLNKDRTKLLRLPGSENFPAYEIESLTTDYFGNIWFGSANFKMGQITDNGGVFSVTYFDAGHFIFADPNKPEVYIATTQGIVRKFLDATGKVIKSTYYKTNDSKTSLSSNYIWPIYKIDNSLFWVGTIGGGLNLVNIRADGAYSAKVYSTKTHIFNDVESLQTDAHGNVWMGGKGLIKFNPKTNAVTKYDKNDGLQGNSFKVGASYKGYDGRLYFGGINGLNYFYPDSIKANPISATPHFTDILVNNKRIDTTQSSNLRDVLNGSIAYCKSIALTYLQNNFIVSFSAMHFANPLKCQFRYKLIGFDNEWKYTNGSNPTAAYNNLDYKDYKLILEATNNDGVWSAQQATLDISILPPWWKSAVAKIIYFILFLSFLVGIYIYQARWFRLKRVLAVREVEENKREELHQQQEQLHQQQLQFFTNISHEFRTPLTLILGPLEKLVKVGVESPHYHSFEMMFRNAKRLINLINELMNFRKVADSAIKLHVAPIDLDNFLSEMYDEFSDLADSRQITFTLTKHEDASVELLDEQILEKILSNLLNNAFKYSTNGGKVELEIFTMLDDFTPIYEANYNILSNYKADKYIYFRIADKGIGVSADSIAQIFERYYRIGNNHLGSGVGLALVKSLTLLHKGNIYVYSERNRGTEIIIALPLNANSYTLAETTADIGDGVSVELEKIEIEAEFDLLNKASSTTLKLPTDSKRPHILIVEDNDELRLFLKQSLQQHYNIHEAADGAEGLAMAIEKSPDLIISDVMMPVMNGVELCKNIKQEFDTCHIPFMILSARDALDARLEGLVSGADHYFAKPISIDFLLLTVNNIFLQKEKLRSRFTKDYYAEASELVHSTQDKEFLEKMIALIEANINLAELDVDFICQNLFASRSKVYQKIKSISGQSIGEFIRTIRLKKAVYILTHENVALNEVADRVGIQSVSYFSRAFKKEFGKSPSQFLQTIKSGK